jgi:hypothetical protein
MFTEVQPVPAAAPTTGLVASAIRPADGERWESGMAWRPERCVTTQGISPCGTVAGVPADPDVPIVYYTPPGFRMRDFCTTLTRELDVARLQRQVNAVTSFEVARELWEGALTLAEPATVDGSPYTNPYLADGNATDVTAPADLDHALMTLEAAARAGMTHGMQVYLHVPVSFLNDHGNLYRRVGNQLLTATDGVIVADAGYTGRGAPVAGTPEVQTATITGVPTGGTWTLTYSAQTTATIPFNAIGSTVQTELNALSNLDGVTVAGGAGGPYTVTFPIGMGNPAQMTGSGAGLTGGTAPAVGVATTTPYVAPSFETGTWIYATGPVQVRLSPVAVLDDESETINRVDNRQEIWAERLFAATFDPCIHYAMDLGA